MLAAWLYISSLLSRNEIQRNSYQVGRVGVHPAEPDSRIRRSTFSVFTIRKTISDCPIQSLSGKQCDFKLQALWKTTPCAQDYPAISITTKKYPAAMDFQVRIQCRARKCLFFLGIQVTNLMRNHLPPAIQFHVNACK
jgi:hypothetical protein